MIGDETLPFVLRRRKGARRMTLRLSRKGDEVVLTLPMRVSVAEGMAFVESRKDWLAKLLARTGVPKPLGHGSELPFLGLPHRVQVVPALRGRVERKDGEIHISGDPAFLTRRLRDWLMAEAKRDMAPRVAEKARQVDKKVTRLSFRDTQSRWGSCGAEGRMSLCWRLILAPEFVRDYVVAHEVAHLLEMNHGPRFWQAVDRLTPHAEAGRAWLKREGWRLHAVVL